MTVNTGKPVRRRTLKRAKVVDSALDIVDARGLDELSMSACAEQLGVVTASLYNHVENLDDLKAAVQVAAMTTLGEHLTLVAMGRSGPAGLRALMDAHRQWATSHPRRYHALTAASSDPDALIAAAMKVNDALRAMLHSCGVSPDETFDAAASLFAVLHGFSSLVNSGFIAEGRDRERIYESVVRGALSGITRVGPVKLDAPIEEDYS